MTVLAWVDDVAMHGCDVLVFAQMMWMDARWMADTLGIAHDAYACTAIDFAARGSVRGLGWCWAFLVHFIFVCV